jgi:methyltransferase (TIGR00027 family)
MENFLVSTRAAGPRLSDVTDTAAWIAGERARESDRPDALFHDPYARALAGEIGRELAALTERRMGSSWSIAVRTRMIDELIASSIADGCDCVINLAAGLDTRPYRLALPRSLRWVEVDLPPLIERKQRILHAETPNCQVIREAVDLADSTARRRFLDQQRAHSARALVLSEGLLHYLHERDVQILAADLAAHGFDTWAFDLMSPATARKLRTSVGVEWERAPIRFAPTQGVAFFEATGWQVVRASSAIRTGASLRRLPPLLRLLSLFPDPDPRNFGKHTPWFGLIKLTKPTTSA